MILFKHSFPLGIYEQLGKTTKIPVAESALCQCHCFWLLLTGSLMKVSLGELFTKSLALKKPGNDGF